MTMNRQRILTITAAGFILLAGSSLGSYAANGGPVMLGKTNTATKSTTIKTTGNGPALKLKSKKSKAPFSVNSKTKVKKLNADRVDGLNGSALQNKTYVYNLTADIAGNIVRWNLPGVPAGKYLATYSINGTMSGSPTFFGCFFDSGPVFANATLASLGVTSGSGSSFFVSGSGVLDATSRTYSMTCQSSGSTGITVPTPASNAQVSLTRIDKTTTAGSAGSAATPPPRQRGFGG